MIIVRSGIGQKAAETLIWPRSDLIELPMPRGARFH